jgi:DNA ligase-1
MSDNSKPFRPLLAAETPPLEELERLRHFPMLASYKLDGIRAIVRNGVVVSRSMKPIPSRYVQERWGKMHLEGLDGELLVPKQVGPTIYHDTYSAVMTHGSEEPVRFHVFDLVSNSESQYNYRRDRLEQLLDMVKDQEIIQLEQRHVETVKDILDMEQEALDAGHEGLIVRRPDGRYKQGRSTLKEGILVKVARFLTSEAIVDGFEEMYHNDNQAETNALGFTERSSHQANMRPSGMLGALLVHDTKTGVAFRIGTGFDQELRKHIWAHRHSEYLGKIAKYKFKPYGVKDAPRQPSFLGWRSPEDMS